MESARSTKRSRNLRGVDRKSKTLKKGALDTKLDRAIMNKAINNGNQNDLQTNLAQAYSKNLFDYHKKGLLDIINRNDHFQNCGACTSTRNKVSRKNDWISSGQKGYKFSNRRPKSQARTYRQNYKGRPSTASTMLKTRKKSNFGSSQISQYREGDEYEPNGFDQFQTNIGPFAQGNFQTFMYPCFDPVIL